jgi:RNA polymerase sigma-70 factor (ECF subfamily)
VIRHERRVLLLAWRLLGNLADAQDAAQEVFLRAFRYLHRFDRRRPFEPWIVRMTVNVCRDAGGRRQRSGAVFSDTPFSNSEPARPALTGNPLAELVSAEQRQLARHALAHLPEKERTAVVLRDIEGLSTAEVAELLGSSEPTVRAQISRARVKMKKAIERLRGGEP